MWEQYIAIETIKKHCNIVKEINGGGRRQKGKV